MTTIFASSSIEFEEKMLNPEVIEPEQPVHFGVFQFEAVENLDLKQVPRDFIFTGDNSASMEDLCKDGRSKFKHSQHTLKNMVRYIHKNIPLASVTIYSFNDKTVCIVERTALTDENIQDVLAKIDTVYADGSTNIENALTEIKKCVNLIQETFSPENEIYHVFMTDGDVTSGSSDVSVLKKLIVSSISNYFIGFGKDHNSQLLNAICENEQNNSYRFIDTIENSGIIYGEIMNEFLYKILTNVKVTVTNGLIYDYKNNIWTSSLTIDNIISENKKTYHIISSSPESCIIELIGKNLQNEDITPILFSEVNMVEQLQNYIFRQRTMQLMYKCKIVSKGKSTYSYGRLHLETEYKVLKTELRSFLDEMKKYMEENNLKKDKILKNLCDDIYICYHVLFRSDAQMYINSRHASQGSQRSYSARYEDERQTDNYYDAPFSTSRQCSSYVVDCAASLVTESNDSEISTIILDHQLSNFADAPYTTPRATSMMRELSQGVETSDIFYDDVPLESNDPEISNNIILDDQLCNFADEPYTTQTPRATHIMRDICREV